MLAIEKVMAIYQKFTFPHGAHHGEFVTQPILVTITIQLAIDHLHQLVSMNINY